RCRRSRAPARARARGRKVRGAWGRCSIQGLGTEWGDSRSPPILARAARHRACNAFLPMATTLELVLLYLVAAVAGVVLCRSLKLPPMLGYLVVGVLIGPNTLALTRDSAGVKYLAEFGVVFLMFVIGLEFNLPKLRSMRTLVFGLGLSQVALTILGAIA